MTQTTKPITIADLNDAFRLQPFGGPVRGMLLMTRGIAALEAEQKTRILRTVQTFRAFTPENDPWHEHDFGCFQDEGVRVMWKFDYYADAHLNTGAESGLDCYRVLTILLAEEY
jgi:hypothetical protein